MNIDKKCQERITELESDLEAEGQRIDLLLERLYELQDENRKLRGQLQNLRIDRRYEVA